MHGYRSRQEDLRKEAPVSATASRYVLIVRAPGIGLTVLDANRWTVMEKRGSLEEIRSLFTRACAFIGDRGEVAVVQQRLVGREVETRIVERHRATGAISPSDFVALDHTTQKVFWNCVARSALAREQKMAAPVSIDRPMRPMAGSGIKAAKASRWKPALKDLAALGGLAVASVAIVLLFPPVSAFFAFLYEAMGRRYGF
jgi:hypothetical protein